MPLQMSHELCVAHLNPGGCSRGRLCSKRHDIWRCGCGLVLLNLNYGSHMNGARHRKLLREAQKSAGVNTTDGMPIVSIHSYLWTLCNDSGNRSRSLSCVLNVAIMCSSQICQLTMPNIKEWLTRNPYDQLQDTTKDRNLVAVSGQDGLDFGVIETAGTSTREIKLSLSDGHGRVALEAVDLRSEYLNGGVSGPSRFLLLLLSFLGH